MPAAKGTRPPNAGKGRPKGVPNKVTRAINEITLGLFDDAYWLYTYKRLNEGKLPPQIEAKLLAYAYGEPKQTVGIEGSLTMDLAKKVIHELHPGPTKSPHGD